MQSNLPLCGVPTVTPYMRHKHRLLYLISFVQFNKKGFHTILNRYVQHDRLIPQMKLVPFQVVEIIVRTASMACLQGDGSRDKGEHKVRRGKEYTLDVYFFLMQTWLLFSMVWLNWRGLTWVSWAPAALQSVLLAERNAFPFWVFAFLCL